MKHKLWRLWRSVSSREKHDACQVDGCTLGKSNFEDQSLSGAICRLQLGCADVPSCSPQGRKALPERPHDSQFPSSSLQARAGGYWECLPRATCCISSPNPGLASPLLLPPASCQLKSRLSLDSPQVMLSMAQLECVPALFSSFSHIFSSLLIVLSLLSHPLCLL